MPMTLGRRQVTVQYGHSLEARLESPASLRSEADFRNQDDRLPAILQHLVDGLNVDFRLAAARHTMNHDRFVTPLAQRLQDRLQSGLPDRGSSACARSRAIGTGSNWVV